jgi:hypothetical protein
MSGADSLPYEGGEPNIRHTKEHECQPNKDYHYGFANNTTISIIKDVRIKILLDNCIITPLDGVRTTTIQLENRVTSNNRFRVSIEAIH